MINNKHIGRLKTGSKMRKNGQNMFDTLQISSTGDSNLDSLILVNKSIESGVKRAKNIQRNLIDDTEMKKELLHADEVTDGPIFTTKMQFLSP